MRKPTYWANSDRTFARPEQDCAQVGWSAANSARCSRREIGGVGSPANGALGKGKAGRYPGGRN